MSSTNNKKTIEILHLAMSFGLILIIGTFYYLRYSQEGLSFSTEFSSFNLIAVSSGIAGLLIAQFLFKSLTKNQNTHRINDENFSKMKPAYLTKWLIIEAAGLINAMLFFLSGNLLLLYFAIALSLVLY